MDIRIASYNVEHFNNLFDSANQPDPGPAETRFRVSAARQLEAVAEAMRAMDADICVIIEGPDTSSTGRDTIAALRNFASAYGLRTTDAAIGFPSRGQQEIAMMFDPTRLRLSHAPRGLPLAMTQAEVDALSVADRAAQFETASDILSNRKLPAAPRFDTVLPFDSEDDSLIELYRFARPPFEATVEVLDGGTPAYVFTLIGAHTKSKGIFDVEDTLRDEIKNLSNRRRILAECTWLRARVDELLDIGMPVVVAGDFNDGPGLDFYERSFGRSGVEIVAGQLDEPDRILRALTLRASWSGSRGWRPSTASFYQPSRGKFFNALIDFVLVSPDLFALSAQTKDAWRIWNPFEDSVIKADVLLSSALKDASDHFPVTFDFTIATS